MALSLADFSIAQKIAFACLVPLIGLAIFAGAMVVEARQKAAAADEVLAATALAEGASLAVHELQRERGMSVGFVASKGATFAAELPKQREETDRRVKAFNDAVGAAGSALRAGALGARLDAATAALKTIDALRQRIASLAIPAPEAGAAYTQAIGTMIGTVDAIAELSTDTVIVRAIGIYAAVVRGKEFAGQERAAGSRGFASGRFSAPDLRGFVALAASQEQQFDVLRRQGSAIQQDELKAVLASQAEQRRGAHARRGDRACHRRSQERGRGAGLVQGLDRADRRVEEGRGSGRLGPEGGRPGSIVESRFHADVRARDVDRPHLDRVVHRLCGGALDHPAARHAGRHDADARRAAIPASRSAAATARTRSAAWRAPSRCSATTRSSAGDWKRPRAPSRRSAKRASAASTR